MNDKALRESAEGRSPQGRMLSTAVSILLAVLLLGVFLRGVDLGELVTALRAARPAYLVAGLLLTVLMYAFRAWRWRNLLLPLVKAPIARLFSITVVGFLAGMLVPRAQEGVRPYLVGRRFGIRWSAAFASIILERFLDLMTVLLLFGLYVFLAPSSSGATEVGRLKTAGAIAALGSLAGFVCLILFHFHTARAVQGFDRLFRHLPFGMGGSLSGFLRSFAEGLAVVRAPTGHLLGLAAQSLLLWLTIDLTVFLNNRAFGLPLPFPSSFLIVAFLLVGVSVPTPGMLGGYHAAYRIALTKVYGVGNATAVAAGLTGHAVSNLPVLVLGLALIRGEGLTLGTVREVSETKGESPSDAGGAHREEDR